MALLVVNIVPSQYAVAAQTTVYTVPASTKTIIDKFTVTNVSGASLPFSINLVPAAGAAGPANLILDARTIADEETYTCPEVVGHVLEATALISTLATAATSLVINVSGREIS